MIEQELRALLPLVLKGDAAALTALYRATWPMMITMAERTLPTNLRHLAEDVVQETWRILYYSKTDPWRGLSRYDPTRGRGLKGWILWLTQRRALDVRRNGARQPQALDQQAMDRYLEDKDAPSLDPAEVLWYRELMAQLAQEFSPTDLELFNLHYADLHSPAEIAQILGARGDHEVKPATVLQQLHRMRTRLLRCRDRLLAESPSGENPPPAVSQTGRSPRRAGR